MRTAILFAPQSYESELGAGDDLAELLPSWGFRATHAAGVAAVEQLEHVLADLGEADRLLVHVSGELRSATTLALGPKEVARAARRRDSVRIESLALAELSRMVSDSSVGSALFVLELTFPDGVDDAFALATDVAEIRAAFAESKHSALIALHGGEVQTDPLTFTRLVTRAASDLLHEGADKVLASAVVDRLREMPESHAVARSYTYVDKGEDFDLALPSDDLLDAPDFTALLELAEGARRSGSLSAAVAAYRAALRATTDDEARGDVYELLGAAEERLGHGGRARRAYRKAIGLDPSSRAAHDGLIRVETEGADWAGVLAAMKARLDVVDSPAEKVEELFSIARLTVEKLRDVAAAVPHLEAARAIDGTHEDVLEALRRSYRVLGRWQELIHVTGSLAEQAPQPAERAARHFAQAQIAKKHLEDLDQAAGFLVRALEADPTHDEALDVLCDLRTTRHEETLLHRELATVLERLLDLPDEERAGDVARRMSSLSQDPARRPETTQEITPDQIEEADDEDDAVLAELENQVDRAPLVAKSYSALFRMHLRAGRSDRAYTTALALEELGAVDGAVQAVLEEHRPTGLRVRASFDAEAFRLLRAPGSDEVLESLVRAIGRAGSLVRAEERRAKKRLVVLHEAKKEPKASTASIVRTFHWAADILGVACPDLYILDRVPGDVIAVPGQKRQIAIGPAVLSGLSTIDLAFVCGRHLTYYRPEYSALLDYPSLNELSLLVLSALQLALPAMPVPTNVEPVVTALRNGLKRHLSPEEREAMSVAVAKLDARGGRVNLQAWIRSVELTACRVGLLLCGDLRPALSRLKTEMRAASDVSDESKRIDLLTFCATGTFAALRERVAAITTLRPPPRQSGLMGRADAMHLTLAVDWEEEAAG
jgi:tetratricopeptide (TPR) repeat protein